MRPADSPSPHTPAQCLYIFKKGVHGQHGFEKQKAEGEKKKNKNSPVLAPLEKWADLAAVGPVAARSLPAGGRQRSLTSVLTAPSSLAL